MKRPRQIVGLGRQDRAGQDDLAVTLPVFPQTSEGDQVALTCLRDLERVIVFRPHCLNRLVGALPAVLFGIVHTFTGAE